MRPRRPSRSAEIRLAIGALAFLVAIVATLGTWQVMTARRSQQAEIEDGEVSAAHLASSALRSALTSRLQLLSNLAAQPGLSAIFTKESQAQQAKIAAALHILYPGFASFDVIGAQGRLDARWPADPAKVGTDLSSQAFFAAAMRSGKPYVSQALQQSAAPRELVTLLAAPVRGPAGHIVGLLAASIPGSSLGDLIGGTMLRDGGALLVFDQYGHALMGPAASATRSYRALRVVAGALAGRTGSATGTVPGYSGPRLAGYAPVPSTGWVVVVEEPSSVLTDQIAGLTERLVAIGLVVVVLAVGTVLLVASLLKRLSRERQRAAAVMDSVGEGVATIDRDGVVQSTNPALDLLTGWPASRLAGRRWEEALNLYDQRGNAISWAGSLAAEAAHQRRVLATSGYGLHLARADGQRVPVSMTAAPLMAGTELLGAVVVLRDVSSERQVDQLKSSLVSTVSHELRTPLTMVQGFTELLLSRPELSPERAHEALQQIHGSALRLGRLIEDLLSVSRIDSGKLRVDLAAVDVPDVLGEVVTIVGSHPADGRSEKVASSASERLVVDVAPDLSPVMADRDKLVQVILNLVSNALKYSAPAAPVHVVAERKHDHAQISVIDEGIGMTDTECSQVFEKFARADRPEVRKVSGTGLGLYITKNLVEMQHGQVWVKSEPGKGSIFAFSLPLAPIQRVQGEMAFALQGTHLEAQ
jgi:PAS domain S-box-containing protein